MPITEQVNWPSILEVLGYLTPFFTLFLGYYLGGRTERNSQKRAHDIDIFKRSEAIANEQQLLSLFDELDCLSVNSHELNVLEQLHNFHNLESNKFIYKKLNNQSCKTFKALYEVAMFASGHFFHQTGTTSSKIYLYPDHKASSNDEERAFREQKAIDLRGLLKEAREKLEQYRAEVRKKLYV